MLLDICIQLLLALFITKLTLQILFNLAKTQHQCTHSFLPFNKQSHALLIILYNKYKQSCQLKQSVCQQKKSVMPSWVFIIVPRKFTLKKKLLPWLPRRVLIRIRELRCYGIIVLFALYLYLFDGGIILLSGIELLRVRVLINVNV